MVADPFRAAARFIFGSPVSKSGIYLVGGDDPLPTPVRVVVKDADPTIDAYGLAMAVEGVHLDLLASQVATPKAGDTVDVEGVRYTLRGEPVFDRVGGIWSCPTDGGQ